MLEELKKIGINQLHGFRYTYDAKLIDWLAFGRIYWDDYDLNLSFTIEVWKQGLGNYTISVFHNCDEEGTVESNVLFLAQIDENNNLVKPTRVLEIVCDNITPDISIEQETIHNFYLINSIETSIKIFSSITKLMKESEPRDILDMKK